MHFKYLNLKMWVNLWGFSSLRISNSCYVIVILDLMPCNVNIYDFCYAIYEGMIVF